MADKGVVKVPAPTRTVKRCTTLAPTSMAYATKSVKNQLDMAGQEETASQLVPQDERIIKDVPTPETRRLDENMVFGSNGMPVVALLKQHFAKEGRLSEAAVLRIIREARALFRKESNLLEVAPPVVVVGDLHGQFYDLISIFDIAGQPSAENRFLFLGDYVDRGDFSIEIALFLFACKLNWPQSVFMLRGNHETRLLGEYMTFQVECEYKYSSEVYQEFELTFDTLPLACVLKNTVYGDCLAVHGGVGPSLRKVTDMNKVDRFAEIPGEGMICDLVWSDPVGEWDPTEPEFENMSREDWEEIEFQPNSIRHSSVMYGPRAISKFLRENNLCCIIRGHQVQNEGYLEHFLTDDAPIAPVLTVFSAPNYCDQYGNKGAFLHVYRDRFEIQQFRSVPHPYNLPDFIDGITYSLPFLLEHVVGILQQLVLQLKAEGRRVLTADEKAADEKLASKTKQLYIKSQKARSTQEEMRRITSPEKLSQFEKMLRLDADNEAMPSRTAKARLSPKPGLKRTESFHSTSY
eukprot:m51a1_g11302 putative serine threonine protein phosphatase 2b catalytic (520) ;mRNA; r:71032-73204